MRKKWSKQEEEILMGEIKNTPYNIKKACVNAAIKIERSDTACEQHWYKSLKDKSFVFCTISNKKYVKNKKIAQNANKSTSHNIWNKLLTLLKIK